MNGKAALAGAAVVVPGGLALFGGIVFGTLFSAAKTGDDNLDRFGIRGRVVLHALLTFRTSTTRELVRALMTIVKQESGGKPQNYRHDLNASGGPGIGPMAVNRGTAKALDLWAPPDGASAGEERDAFLELADDEGVGIAMGVRVFQDKLRLAQGDVAEALRRYNGSGPAAETYKANALAFAQDTWGVTLGAA